MRLRVFLRTPFPDEVKGLGFSLQPLVPSLSIVQRLSRALDSPRVTVSQMLFF